ncbi:TetR/AcrR family transcriptional regulator [Streptacidiphilus neutrinimicus]|uniref:TetR/AcrR family transcriptional regulator n=1 Tax=Streptacidiphilus neutrinimicus TaxID=105420 RepID=UPI0005A7DD6F|nr:TetR/AcrR family transcriptional regulator [Streptacidiphilus neutrinimicus]
MPTRPADRYHHGDLRNALIETGLEMARTGGPDAVVLRAVSRSAGVSHNAAYRHFADHEDLLAAVSARCLDRLGALMRERAQAERHEDPVERAWARLGAIGRAYVDFARAEPGWFRTAFRPAAVPAPNARGRSADDLAADHPFAQLAACLDDLVAVGALSAERRPDAEYAAWSAVHGLSVLLVEGPLAELADSRALDITETVLTVVSRGL